MIQAHVALHGPVISWDNFQMSCKGHQLRPYLESLIFISLILYQNVTHSTDIWKRVQHLCFLLCCSTAKGLQSLQVLSLSCSVQEHADVTGEKIIEPPTIC
ncbi:uncharacterized protein [Gossypium hirsutum]|uniref:Uncharacterized protein isoform X2 n=1 Tax=Gossypium hirsutum TaxID=3635 RepID=A0ABM3B7T6_GOSHI|nr:uncharacterized protein LOC121224267 isoform X2 [Gossypium hirsutum]